TLHHVTTQPARNIHASSVPSFIPPPFFTPHIAPFEMHDTIFYIPPRTPKNTLCNIYNLRSSPIGNGGRESAKILWPPLHELLDRWLVGHRCSESTMDRRTFSLNQVEKGVKRHTGATIGLVTHREHVHAMRPDPRVDGQRLD